MRSFLHIEHTADILDCLNPEEKQRVLEIAQEKNITINEAYRIMVEEICGNDPEKILTYHRYW